MKLKKIILLLPLICLIFCGCAEVKNNTQTLTCSMSEGESLHVDTKLGGGTVDVTVSDGKGTELFSETLTSSYDYGVEVFTAGDYTVKLAWHNANGSAQIYSEKDGKRLNTFMGQGNP